MRGEPILIIGDSGSGKSTSLMFLNPTKTFIQRATAKAPINVGGVWKYYQEDTDDIPGNTLYVTSPSNIENGEHIPKLGGMLQYCISRGFDTYVIDDFQFLLLNIERDLKNTGDYKDARVIYKIIKSFILGCISQAQAVSSQIRTVFIWQNSSELGKLLIPGTAFTEDIKPQGFFNVVLESFKDPFGLYFFRTKGPGMCKTPAGMFDEEIIPNDLDLVFERMEYFYQHVDMFKMMPRFKSAQEQKDYYKKLKEQKGQSSNAVNNEAANAVNAVNAAHTANSTAPVGAGKSAVQQTQTPARFFPPAPAKPNV